MLKKLEDMMKSVVVFTTGVKPLEDSPVNIGLSWAAFALSKLDEPLCVVETYLLEDGVETGRLDLVYHADHDIQWELLQLECYQRRFRCFDRIFLPVPAYNQGLQLRTMVVRVNFKHESREDS